MRSLPYLLALLMVSCLFTGCKTRYVTLVERDTVSHATLVERHDTLLVRDSVTVWQQGDTVYRDRYRTVYRAQETNSKDTTKQKTMEQNTYPTPQQTASTPQKTQEKKKSPFALQLQGFGVGVALSLIIWLVTWIKKEKILDFPQLRK